VKFLGPFCITKGIPDLLLKLGQFSLLLPEQVPHVLCLADKLRPSFGLVAFAVGSGAFQLGGSSLLADPYQGRIELHVVHCGGCCCVSAAPVRVEVLRASVLAVGGRQRTLPGLGRVCRL
jgi:hypothetical protein